MWTEKTFAELGYTYTGLSGKNKADFGSGEPYIPYMNVFSNESVDPQAFEYVQIRKGERQNAVTVGDALFTTSSETPEEVGMSSVLTEDVGTVYLNSFCFGLRLYKPMDFDPKFLSYALRSEQIRKQMFIAAQGSTRHNLSKQNFNRMRLMFPTETKEQSHIATVLNASDQAITSSRELVEKYSAIKQGLMHDLFNPLARDTALGDTGTWYGGITPSMNNPRYWGEGHFWLSSGEVKSATLDRSTRKITDSALANTTLRLLPKGTIVVVVRSGILKNYFPVAELQTPMAINQDLKGIVLQEGINSKYILYVLEFFGDEILRKCMKAGTTVQSVELKWLKAFKIPLPEAKEQDRIVEILTAVNERLIAEQQRLRKLEDIKRGLMNDLLTNRVSTDQLQGGV